MIVGRWPTGRRRGGDDYQVSGSSRRRRRRRRGPRRGTKFGRGLSLPLIEPASRRSSHRCRLPHPRNEVWRNSLLNTFLLFREEYRNFRFTNHRWNFFRYYRLTLTIIIFLYGWEIYIFLYKILYKNASCKTVSKNRIMR